MGQFRKRAGPFGGLPFVSSFLEKVKKCFVQRKALSLNVRQLIQKVQRFFADRREKSADFKSADFLLQQFCFDNFYDSPDTSTTAPWFMMVDFAASLFPHSVPSEK